MKVNLSFIRVYTHSLNLMSFPTIAQVSVSVLNSFIFSRLPLPFCFVTIVPDLLMYIKILYWFILKEWKESPSDGWEVKPSLWGKLEMMLLKKKYKKKAVINFSKLLIRRTSCSEVVLQTDDRLLVWKWDFSQNILYNNILTMKSYIKCLISFFAFLVASVLGENK